MTNALKTVAFAGLLGTGLMLAGTTSASADYVKTGCNGDGYCRTVQCDNDRDNCVVTREFYRRPGVDYDRSYYSNSRYYDYREPAPYPMRHYVCDSDGEYCHWTTY
jgi:hypothetical protein